MVAEQPTRKVVKDFRDKGRQPASRQPRGSSHTKWECPCGRHQFTLPDGHRTISPGVVAKAYNALEQCGEERK